MLPCVCSEHCDVALPRFSPTDQVPTVESKNTGRRYANEKKRATLREQPMFGVAARSTLDHGSPLGLSHSQRRKLSFQPLLLARHPSTVPACFSRTGASAGASASRARRRWLDARPLFSMLRAEL